MYFVQSVVLTLFLTISIHSAPNNLAPICRETEFQCKTGKICISNELVCNTLQNCKDGSDEDVEMCNNYRSTHNMTNASSIIVMVNSSSIRCKENEFKCANGLQCISNKTTCNGFNDCNDGSDEVENWCKTRLCPEERFKCISGQCILSDSLCDGYFDCADASDEDETICKIE